MRPDNIFFTSDTHFGHKKILTLGEGRPFDTIEEHDEYLIERWNAVVPRDGYVIHLGDAVMGRREVTLPLLDRLNGTKVLVPGNHDTCSSVEREARRGRFMDIYGQYFAEIWPETVHMGAMTLSHYPPAEIPDHDENDRYPHLRPVGTEGTKVFLHGHSHQTHTHTYLADGRVAINVGVDANNWTPVRMSDIPEVMAVRVTPLS